MTDSPKVVLLVDDDEIVRRATKRILRDCGAELREYPNGEEALNQLRAGLRPALIVSDVDMPVMNGLRLAMYVKEEFPTVPIVLLSGGDHSATAETIGVQYLPKPVNPTELRELVKKAL